MSRQQSVDAVLHLLATGGWLPDGQPTEARGQGVPGGPGH
jgi:hypothetical protein